jgi:hypothetical protein
LVADYLQAHFVPLAGFEIQFERAKIGVLDDAFLFVFAEMLQSESYRPKFGTNVGGGLNVVSAKAVFIDKDPKMAIIYGFFGNHEFAFDDDIADGSDEGQDRGVSMLRNINGFHGSIFFLGPNSVADSSCPSVL